MESAIQNVQKVQKVRLQPFFRCKKSVKSAKKSFTLPCAAISATAQQALAARLPSFNAHPVGLLRRREIFVMGVIGGKFLSMFQDLCTKLPETEQ